MRRALANSGPSNARHLRSSALQRSDIGILRTPAGVFDSLMRITLSVKSMSFHFNARASLPDRMPVSNSRITRTRMVGAFRIHGTGRCLRGSSGWDEKICNNCNFRKFGFGLLENWNIRVGASFQSVRKF